MSCDVEVEYDRHSLNQSPFSDEYVVVVVFGAMAAHGEKIGSIFGKW